LHLDSKMETLPTEKSKIRREDVLRTFERLTDYATENGVSVVIIAGDMFDTSRVTIRTRERVIKAIENNSTVEFLYLSGNHDDDNFVSTCENLPCNFKVFSDKWSAFDYGEVVVSGVKLTTHNCGTIYDDLSLDEKRINIVTLHGQIADYKGSETAQKISLPLLKDKNIDYLALGHVHEYSQGQLDLRGKYAYAGCLEGRGFDELGDKGFVLIEVEDGNLNTNFVEFSSRSLHQLDYDITEKHSWIDARAEILSLAKDYFDTKSLVKVLIKGEHDINLDVDKDGLSLRLNEMFFFAKVYDKTKLKITADDYALDKTVRGEFVRAVWESDLDADEKYKVIMCGLNALKGEDF
ncbi:MAG: DNA repair exonuclease, partial [Clostridia bacterium]|nr:DNA repair exonuclease [Clostridia bacterium]